MDSTRVSATGNGNASDVLPAIWKRHEPLGYALGLVSFSSVAAPLLTGFSLTTIVELLGREKRGTHGDIAIALFAIAASLLIYAIQSGLAASQLTVPPDQRAAQTPEARGDADWLKQLRQEQWRDAALAGRLFTRTQLAYNLGIVAFLGGVAAVLFPSPKDWNPVRIVALLAIGIAGIIELILVSGELRMVRQWLFPTLDGVPTEEDRSSTTEPEEVDTKLVRRLIYGEIDSTDQNQSPDVDGEELATEVSGLTAQLAALTGQLASLEVAIREATEGSETENGV